MKWTWDKFGYYTSELVADAAPILECLRLSADSATVQFFTETSMALVVCDFPGNVGPDRIDAAKRASCWDVTVCNSIQLQEMQSTARTQLSRLDLDSELVDELIAKGIFTLDDISGLEPNRLAQLIRVDSSEADALIERADLLCWEDNRNNEDTSR